MTRSPYRIKVARERYKFSCAHMTVFPGGRKERLHGHNYFVAVALDLSDVEFENLVDFGPIKAAIAELCAAWKERVLIAHRNPYFELVHSDAAELEFRLCGKRYVLPAEDALVLPVDNISVEALAAHALDLLAERLAPVLTDVVTGIEVTVEETPGQGASCYRALG